MRLFRTIVLASLVLLLLLSGCKDSSQISFLRPNDTILAFGDSLTRGNGAGEKESYPAQLERMIARKVINAGVPGEVSAEGLKRLPGLLDELEPDFLILCHGGNDFLRRLDRAQTIANIKGMIEAAQARKIPVVIVAVPQLGLLIDPAPFYKELADQYSIPIEEDVLSDILTERELKSDSIHPNAAGYRVMAESIAQLLKKSGAI